MSQRSMKRSVRPRTNDGALQVALHFARIERVRIVGGFGSTEHCDLRHRLRARHLAVARRLIPERIVPRAPTAAGREVPIVEGKARIARADALQGRVLFSGAVGDDEVIEPALDGRSRLRLRRLIRANDRIITNPERPT
jgi:hypothetical protein